MAQPPASGQPPLFPNPAHAVNTVLDVAPRAPVQVLDALGWLVATAQADATGQATLPLPVELASGGYVVRAGFQSIRLTVE